MLAARTALVVAAVAATALGALGGGLALRDVGRLRDLDAGGGRLDREVGGRGDTGLVAVPIAVTTAAAATATVAARAILGGLGGTLGAAVGDAGSVGGGSGRLVRQADLELAVLELR